ncbi:tetraspanin-9-like [Plodia interpunctella]|uniref:tetraspanin-9-like n=1 Tax=Plodia interpunctella TaxID=58824 RepID=UPI002367B539|nr:tetraspanin-9-like [Plodia interpunctella]XP_053599719.1 tetraspanin-9-like [Plodia interpunctella]
MRSGSLVLFICAGLLLSGGSVLCFSTLWSILRMSYYFWSTELGVELSGSALFVTGALLCLPASWLATLVPQHSKSLTLMCTLMVLSSVSLMLLSSGLTAMTGLSRTLREPDVLNASMLRSMAYDSLDPSVRSSFAAMQLELKCCGVMSYTDWYEYRRSLPPSCCGKMTYGKHPDSCTTPVYPMGCLRPALAELRRHVRSTTTFAAALIVVMGTTLFTTAYLLVTNVVERREATIKPQTVRIACISPHGTPPLVSVTSPTLLPNPVPNNHL